MDQSVILWISGQNDRENPSLAPFWKATEKEVKIDAVGEDDLAEYLDAQAIGRVIGAIIAPSVQAPVAVARRFLRQLPGSEVIFIAGEDAEDSAKRTTNLAFLYGHHRTLNPGDTEEGAQTIRRLLGQAKRQQRSRWALARMNEQIAEARDEVAHQKRVAISDRLLVSILAQSPDALIALDLDGFVLAVNRAAVSNFDLSDAEGLPFEKTGLSKRLPELKSLVAAAVERKENRRQSLTLKGTGGDDAEAVSLEASASPVFHEDNRLIGITVLLRDVSELKRAERSLREMNEVLEQRVHERTQELEKLNRQMEDFLYSVAHDLRAPVRSISGFTRLLQEEHGRHLNEEALSFILRIFQATQRMDLLIRDLLAYSRVAKIELPREQVELETVLQTALDEVAEQAERCGAKIQVESSAGRVWAHQTTLEQVVINLLSNALHYAKPEEPPRIRVFDEWKNGRCRLWVQDNGIGIDPNYHAKIFNIFERVAIASNPSGTGIGLAIVKGGVERMGGSAGVESEPGKGSSFWIDLPAARPPEEGA